MWTLITLMFTMLSSLTLIVALPTMLGVALIKLRRALTCALYGLALVWLVSVATAMVTRAAEAQAVTVETSRA